MSPNPFTLVKLAFSPHRWAAKKRSSSTESVKPREEWNLPVRGIYEYKAGRGWYLVEYLEDVDNASVSNASTTTTKRPKEERLPRQVTYCKVLHRMMFTSEYNERRRIEYVRTNEKYDVEQACFFRMDDGVTYVKCWDAYGHFVPGPWQPFCIDAKTQRMRPMQARDVVVSGQEGAASRRTSFEKLHRQQSEASTSHKCSNCSTPSVRSLARPAYEGRASASTFAESSRSQGTALTTPSSGFISRQPTTEEVDPKELRAELAKLRNN